MVASRAGGVALAAAAAASADAAYDDDAYQPFDAAAPTAAPPPERRSSSSRRRSWWSLLASPDAAPATPADAVAARPRTHSADGEPPIYDAGKSAASSVLAGMGLRITPIDDGDYAG